MYALRHFRCWLLLWLAPFFASGDVAANTGAFHSLVSQDMSGRSGKFRIVKIRAIPNTGQGNREITWQAELVGASKTNQSTQFWIGTATSGPVLATGYGPTSPTTGAGQPIYTGSGQFISSTGTTTNFILGAKGDYGYMQSFPMTWGTEYYHKSLTLRLVNQSQNVASLNWYGTLVVAPPGATVDLELVAPSPEQPAPGPGNLGVAAGSADLVYAAAVPEPESGWVWNEDYTQGQEWSPGMTRDAYSYVGPFDKGDATEFPFPVYTVTVTGSGEPTLTAPTGTGTGATDPAVKGAPGQEGTDTATGTLQKYTPQNPDGSAKTPPVEAPPASYANASGDAKAIIDAQLTIEARTTLKMQQEANQREALIRAVRTAGLGGGSGGGSTDMTATNQKLDGIGQSLSDHYGQHADAMEGNPTVGEMEGEGAAAGAQAAALIGTPGGAANVGDDLGAPPSFALQFPAAFGGATVNLNPFSEGRFNVIATWFRSAMVWTVVIGLGAWLWLQISEYVKGFSTIRQAQGNAVVGGTGAQGTALIAAGLITVAIVTATTALLAWGLNTLSVSAIGSAIAANPVATMPAGALWMLNQLFPVGLMISAAVARVTFPWYGAGIYATCAAVVRFIVP